MAGKSRQVTIQFLGDANSFISATGKATRATDTFGGKLKGLGKAALVGFGIAAVAAGKVMYEFADAAIEDEKSAALLARTLKNATGATKAQVSATEDWITAQGKAFGVADDDLRPALSKLATATGSITKAQKLAGLAMDVSAGTGKDLQSITLAIAKAQNGSLAGLGRLGVATKNASGETKTLAEITDDLAKKYKGAAATAADTAAGKFQRLKLELSETGESIGYKLLPYANDLGDWLLRVGVPALEDGARAAKRELTPALKDLSGFVRENKDDLADLGRQITDTVIPAIRDVGGLVGDAVSFFSGLPDPVKRVGIEAGIAAAVIPRLSSAIDGVNAALGGSASKLTGWRKGLLLASGIGGVAAMTEGAKTGNKAVSLFGDALTGAFVGGTLGSAIPVIGTAIGAAGGAAVGAGIGLFKMHKQADNAGKSASAASPKIDGLKESLNQVSGAATRATKALILQELQEKGVVTSASQLGIAASDLIKSVNGNEKAINRVNDAWTKHGDLLDGLQNSKISGFLSGMRAELSKDQKEIKDTNAALDGTDRAARKARPALAGIGKDRPSTNKWAALYGGDLDKAAADTGTFSRSTRRLLGEDIGKARAKMGPFGNDLISQLTGVKGRANRSGIAIGNSIQTGVMSGLSGLVAQVQQAVAGAVAVGHQIAANAGGGGGGGGKKHPKTTGGNNKVVNLDDYRSVLGGMDPRRAEIAGNNLVESIARGLKKGERTLKNVMEGLHNYIKDKTDRLSDLVGEKSSFVENFRSAFSENLFGGQFSDTEGNAVPPTLQRMMDFAKQQQSNAKALAANIKSLLNKGLSRDLINQLVSQGQSGFDQIAALSMGSQADIQAFNQINADIKSTLEGLGEDLYATLNPEKTGQIKVLTEQRDSALRQEEKLERIAKNLEKGDKIEIRGSHLVILLRALERETGRKLLVSPA